jgi:hypothetical protein
MARNKAPRTYGSKDRRACERDSDYERGDRKPQAGKLRHECCVALPELDHLIPLYGMTRPSGTG